MQSADAKEQEKGSLLLFRAFKGLPKNKALIKYLSEPGVKASMLKTEAIYMEQNNRRMHEVTDDLYFVINEQHNTIELTDKGIDLITGDSDDALFLCFQILALKWLKSKSQNCLMKKSKLRKTC